MELFTVQCPNCGSNIQSDKSHKSTYCNYCGTQVFATANHILKDTNYTDGESLSKTLTQIRQTIMSNNHKNTEFKDLLLDAVEEDIIKTEVQQYLDSEIWEADIKDVELIGFYGKVKRFFVPCFVSHIQESAFSEAVNLESVYIDDNVIYIDSDIFNEHTSDIIIYTNTVNSTAAKYAVLNKIKFEVINQKYTPKVFSGQFGEFYKLFSEISEIKWKNINLINTHYEYMYNDVKSKIDNSNFRSDYKSLTKIKKAHEYDLKNFYLIFCNNLEKYFDKYGRFDDCLFWNKSPYEIEKDINLLQKVRDDLIKEYTAYVLLYDNFSWFSPKVPELSDYSFQKSRWKTKKFIDML